MNAGAFLRALAWAGETILSTIIVPTFRVMQERSREDWTQVWAALCLMCRIDWNYSISSSFRTVVFLTTPRGYL